MATRVRRKNEGLLNWLRAAALAAAVLGGLVAMQFRPTTGALVLALVAGGFAVIAMDLGVVVAVLALSLPMIAVQPALGIAFALLGVVGVRYLGAEGGRAFLIVAIGIAGAFFGPAWAAVAIAGWLLGAGEGALAAAIACLSVEALGLALGRSSIAVHVTGGSPQHLLLDFSNKMPETMASAAWVKSAFGSISTETVNQVVDAFAAMRDPFPLVAQPALWAAGALVAAVLTREAHKRLSLPVSLLAAAAGVAIPALGTLLVTSGSDMAPDIVGLLVPGLSSLVVALAFFAAGERFFPLQAAATTAPVARTASVAAEDADVDELLRMISTAEDKLASQHTTNKVVMITDMKSFSKMTEEDGSMLTAKAIQRHRDLLVPIIEAHGGHGKSTGGDGLVAAFEHHREALLAAVEMQQVLTAHNTSHPNEREMTVRIGVAQGEVVLDKGGRPFIGAALNLAARVMNLADGGQAFAAADVVRAATDAVRAHSHGPFELKNIAAPVEIYELLWAEDQTPIDPRTRGL